MRTLLAGWAVAVLTLAGAAASGAEWQVGIARADITPTESTWMAGYAARDHPSEGTIHPLWAKALAIDDTQGNRVVLVTTDLIGFERDLADAVAARVKKSTGIDRARIVFNSSHTHSGPVVAGCAELAYEFDEQQATAVSKYRRTLEDKLVQVIEQAAAKLQPADLAYFEGKAGFAINRRSAGRTGNTVAPNPNAPVDHSVPVLHVTDESGKPLAVVFGYACHNTTLAIYQINGDYAGFAQIAWEKSHPGATAMFMIGCGGDSNPDPRRTVELAQQHGQALAAGVEQALAGTPCLLHGPLAVAFDRVDLPFVDPPSREELEARRGKGNKYEQRLTERLLARLAKGQAIDASYACPVQVVRFGKDLAMIALPGEPVIDYAYRLRKEFEGQRLWIAGYSNEVFAYLPSERVLAEGGYEGGGAMVYFGWHGPFKPGVEDRVVALVKKLVQQENAHAPARP
jgi:ABC-type amino acid transport substrate-binding protein